jgi:hypothetical protein
MQCRTFGLQRNNAHVAAAVPISHQSAYKMRRPVMMTASLPASHFFADPQQDKGNLVSNLLAAKRASGLTFTQLAKRLGLSNVFTAQLFFAQVMTQREWSQ